MKKDIADKWVAALRSGKYMKTRHTLFDGVGHCCLGVLCRVKGLEPEALTGRRYAFDKETDLLPESVRIWAEISSRDGDILRDSIYSSLADMNDQGVPFDRIADYIEQKWGEL